MLSFKEFIVGNEKLKRIGKSIYYMPPDHSTDRPILALIQGCKSAIILDAGNSPNHARLFLDRMKPYQKQQIICGIITHWHWDHIFGMSEYDFSFLCCEMTKEKIAELADLKWDDDSLDKRVMEGTEIPFCRDMIKSEMPKRDNLKIRIPEKSFNEKYSIELGNLLCVVEQVGGDHSPDSTILFIPQERVLFLGDCLYMDLYHGERSYSFLNIRELVSRLLRYDVDYFVDSHNGIISAKAMKKRFDKLLLLSELVEEHGEDISKLKTAYRRHYKWITGKDNDIIKAFVNGICKHK